MSPAGISPDVKAVVGAVDALTTQVRRLADALPTPVVEPVLDADDDATTACPTPLTHNWGCGCPTDEAPTADEDDDPPTACWHTEPDTPCDWNICRQPERLAAGDRGTDPATTPRLGPALRQRAQQAPVVDEDAQRTARRDSTRNLLDRLAHRGYLSNDETALLRQHVEAETREHDTVRAVARSNRQHVQHLATEIDRLTAELEDAEQRADGFRQQRDGSDEAARRALEQRQEMAEERYTLQQRAEQLEDLLRVANETSNRSEAERARAVQRAEQADAVTTETKRLLERRTTTLRERAERAEAAIERVRALHTRVLRMEALVCARCGHDWPCDTIRALDGTEQPTTTKG